MTREIKFRAWDKDKKEMITFIPGMSFNDGPKPIPLMNWGDNYHDEYLFNCELMQYTGLKDKNGKEIYESDIIDGGGVVVWKAESAMFGITTGKYDLGSYENLEVIGNIYENSNLLTDGQG